MTNASIANSSALTSRSARGWPISGRALRALLVTRPRRAQARGMLPAEIEREREDQCRRPHVDRIERQRFLAADVVGDEPDDEPDQRHDTPPTVDCWIRASRRDELSPSEGAPRLA